MNLAALQLEGSQAAHRSAPRRQPDGRHRLRRQEERPERRPHPGRRLAQELHAPDRAADPGSARPAESGHDYFLQVTDARPDTGGLSGATPHEAMTWGKVDPEQLPDSVTCYLDSTVALPLLTAYALAKHKPRPPRRLMDRLDELTANLEKEYQKRRRAQVINRCSPGNWPTCPHCRIRGSGRSRPGAAAGRPSQTRRSRPPSRPAG